MKAEALHNGERQVAPDLSGIRRDHTARYEFAARLLGTESRAVLDFACGVGYGTAILAKAGHLVTGLDRSEEAIQYGMRHFFVPERMVLARRDAAHLPLYGRNVFDAAICFETIEHLEDPVPALTAMARLAPFMIASVPNERVFPYRGYAHHFRHYTREEFAELLQATGWEPVEWYGQEGPTSEVEPEIEGRTLIVTARRAEKLNSRPILNGESGIERVRAPVPEHVAIVGLGPSCREFFELTRQLGGVSAYCDEVWGLNAIGDVLNCDRIFHMDDVRVQEARAAARPGSNIAAMVKWLKKHPGPIYTSIVREGYPGMVPFPLEAVLNRGLDGSNGGAPYFNSTAAYAIAFAVHLGVKRISCFGMDFTYPNAHQAEKGRACCEFWLGIAAARGIEIMVPETTTMLDAIAPEEERLYGYDCVDVRLAPRQDGGVAVTFAEKAAPTAAEVERRYDHRAHPNRIVAKELNGAGTNESESHQAV